MSEKKQKIHIEQGAVVTEPGSTVKNKTGNWAIKQPVILSEKCIRCGKCWTFCPDGAIKIVKDDSKYKYRFEIDTDYCKGCMICMTECPFKAIVMMENKGEKENEQ